jgi:hypothetical protein
MDRVRKHLSKVGAFESELDKTIAALGPFPKPTPKFRWEEIDQLTAAPTPPPGSFTVKEYMEHANISHTAAYQRLAQLVKQGKLHVSSGSGCGHTKYYRLATLGATNTDR